MIPYHVLSNILGPRHKAVGKADRNASSLLMELTSLWGGKNKNKISKLYSERNRDTSYKEKNSDIECWMGYSFRRVKRGIFCYVIFNNLLDYYHH